MEKIIYKLKEKAGKITLPEKLGFGIHFSDHVFELDYAPEIGWHNPVIKPLEEISMHPATMFIHYGQAIFEGMKAFKTQKGEVTIFRPEKHFERLNRSARRLCIPEVDVNFMIHALTELVNIERDWIPAKKGEAMYIRPFIYGSDHFLGVKQSAGYKLIILLSPVAAYYPEGFKPVKIMVQDKYVRAVRGGIGECKTPGNYAASLFAAKEAQKLGYTQVLWLDAIEQKYIEEVGTMNIFVRFKDEIATPKLSGTILPGVTRDSVIQILKDWKMNINERNVSIDEVISAHKKGNLLSIFGTGTAAVISPVGWLKYKDVEMTINSGEPDDLSLKLFDAITAIQYGIAEDKHNWITHVNKVEAEAAVK